MRVLIINTSERIGGAAIAANRLMEALKGKGIKAKMLVRDKQTDQVTVVPLKKSWRHIWQFVWERVIIWKANHFKKHNLFAVDIASMGTDITSLPEFQQADVIHLHWINQGMLSLKDIQKIIDSGKPVVWTMHDMWPITGICHHAQDCTKYQTQCHTCPLLYKGSKHDLSYQVFLKKQKLYKKANITFVACSQWLEELARHSVLALGHSVTNIPNPINTNLFRTVPHYLLLSIYIGYIVFFFVIKWILYSFVNWIFFNKTRNIIWLESYFNVVIGAGFLLFPIVLLIVYFDLSPQIAPYFIGFVIIIAKILLFYKCFSNFFNKFHGAFHLILYFCALEILPDFVLWKGIILANNILVLNF